MIAVMGLFVSCFPPMLSFCVGLARIVSREVRLGLWRTCPAMARIKEVGREPAEGEKDTIEECRKKEAEGMSTKGISFVKS